jgi:hypothetical protein
VTIKLTHTRAMIDPIHTGTLVDAKRQRREPLTARAYGNSTELFGAWVVTSVGVGGHPGSRHRALGDHLLVSLSSSESAIQYSTERGLP